MSDDNPLDFHQVRAFVERARQIGKPHNLAAIQDSILPEKTSVRGGSWTSTPALPDDIQILPEYEYVLHRVTQGSEAVFVTGKAGTGKSTLIQWLRAQLEECVVVAPTAIAAATVQGETIHSCFGLPPRLFDPADEMRLSRRAREVLGNLRYLIVDEISMVTPNMVDAIDQRLREAQRDARPFGGVPVVFVGDMLQLPPVVSSREGAVYFSHRYKTRYFFSADVFQELPIIPVSLTQVHRQNDPTFIGALNAIRRGGQCRDEVAIFNRRCYRDLPADAELGTRLVTTNAIAQRINGGELAKVEAEPQVYEARIAGDTPAGRWRLPVPGRLALKVGARVLFMRNNEPEWINGHTGVVTKLDADEIHVRKDITENVVVVKRAVWNRYKYTYDYDARRVSAESVGSFEQFPLSLGWAITIHKSQGMTLDCLTLDLGRGAFVEGQTYVALSRARAIEGIRLARPIAMGDVRVDPMLIRFYQALHIDV